MQWMLVVILLLAFIIGYIAVSMLEYLAPARYAHTKKINVTEEEIVPYLLIFGNGNLADNLKALLESYEIRYLQIDHINALDKTKKYTNIVAVSANDIDNIMIVRIGGKLLEIPFSIAICNQIENRKIFNDYDVFYFSAQSITAEKIAEVLFARKMKQVYNDPMRSS